MFLTKNPRRYADFDFPENCWLGTTYTGNELSWICSHGAKNFISFEPMMGAFYSKGLKNYIDKIDLVIVGAMTQNGKNNIVPKPEWIQSVRDVVPEEKIFWKDNIKKYL
jgi:protein gp37